MLVKKISYLVFFFILGFAGLVWSSEIKSGESVNYSQDTRDDFYVGAGKANLSSNIKGDLVVFGGEIIYKGKVDEDVMIVGGKVTADINGSDDIRLMAGQADLNIKTRGDVFIFGGDINISPDSKIGGDLYIFAGKVTIDGIISGNLYLRGGEAVVKGQLGKNLDIWSESADLQSVVSGSSKISSRILKIGSSAHFKGSVEYWSDPKVDFHSSANSPVFTESLKGKRGEFIWAKFGAVMMAWFLGYAIISIFLFVYFMPRLLPESAQRVLEKPAASLGYGVLFFIGLPALSIFLIATVVGIVHGFFLGAVFVFAMAFGGPLASAILVHTYAMKYNKTYSYKKVSFLALAVFFGLLIIKSIPGIGILIILLTYGTSIGALFMALLNRRKKQ